MKPLSVTMMFIYVSCCSNLPSHSTVVVFGSYRVDVASDLFYSPVSVSGQTVLRYA